MTIEGRFVASQYIGNSIIDDFMDFLGKGLRIISRVLSKRL